eukprot:gb/GECH01011149.1/.p1 GENE.gb/GECH01011149.1/~~gb/GECH01011149.1/.p1  ORF type:complete len:161 (+),score=37.16 gb/GECH01011149.1/:1-483(+)
MTSIHYQLTEEELKEFHSIYHLFDADGNGCITKDELGELMKILGLNPSQEEIDDMMKEVDTDLSGDIDFSEFVQVMSRKIKANYTKEELLDSFKLFESSDLPEGYVTTDTLKHAFTTYGADKLSSEEADQLLKTVDPEGTGKINYKEYVDMMTGSTRRNL